MPKGLLDFVTSSLGGKSGEPQVTVTVSGTGALEIDTSALLQSDAARAQIDALKNIRIETRQLSAGDGENTTSGRK